MGKKSFTLIEIIVVLIIIGILATLGLPNYQNIVEDSKAKVCRTNLAALQVALDIYAMEHDTMPGNWSQIPRRYLEEGYAKVLQQEGAWKIKLAYFVIDWEKRGFVYAANSLSLKSDLAKGEMKMLICPKDLSPDPVHGSYGLNTILKNMISQTYRTLKDTTLIGDCAASEFASEDQLTKRHVRHQNILSKEQIAQGITRERNIYKIGSGARAIISKNLSVK